MSRKRSSYRRGKVIPGGHLPQPKKHVESREMKALMALTALESGFFNGDMLIDLLWFVTECQKIAKARGDDQTGWAVVDVLTNLNSVLDRFERTQKWGINGDERTVLKRHMPGLVEFYRTASRSESSAAGSIVTKRLSAALDASLPETPRECT